MKLFLMAMALVFSMDSFAKTVEVTCKPRRKTPIGESMTLSGLLELDDKSNKVTGSLDIRLLFSDREFKKVEVEGTYYDYFESNDFDFDLYNDYVDRDLYSKIRIRRSNTQVIFNFDKFNCDPRYKVIVN